MTRARYTTNLDDWKQVEDSTFDDIIKIMLRKIEKNRNAYFLNVKQCYSETCE